MLERVLIVDDEPLARQRVARLVHTRQPGAALREAGSGAAAIEVITAWAPQVVFLDIQMPGGDGFSVVEAVGVDRMPPTVFVTAYDAHALRAFDAAAVDYLLKPFDEARFAAAWSRAERLHASRALIGEATRLSALLEIVARGAAAPPTPAPEIPTRIMVRAGERSIFVPVESVRWMQSDGNYVTLHTADATYTLRETLTAMEARLDPARFVRIHRRVIVAIDQIKELQPWFAGDQVLILRDGTKLRVSRTRREAVVSRLEGRG